MSRVDFYHLQKQSLDEVLPKLLTKVYNTGKRAVIRIGDEQRLEQINSYLWTFQDDSFLPHGCRKDGFASEHPIWLTSQNDNPNQAQFLFLVESAECDTEELALYERIFYIFDGNSEQALVQARNLWKKYKNCGCEVFYWQQNNSGKWEQKA
ncbi:MAG: DNA polymerase III subunit chi [Alphaproteobacteria bacterium]|nr:DNA polymerase III subunit chi [Alphaproteobacteria bacterium]